MTNILKNLALEHYTKLPTFLHYCELFPYEEACVEEVLGCQWIAVRVYDKGEEAHWMVAGLTVTTVEDLVQSQHLFCLPLFATNCICHL